MTHQPAHTATAIDQMAGMGVVPVVALDNAADAVPLAETLAHAGLPCAEITLRTPAALDALAQAAAIDGFLAGAGTVLNAGQARQALDAGARFLVSPGLSRGVIEVGQVARVPVLPGVATATEVINALDLGINVVKFFPAATAGGPAAIRALAAPFPGVRFMPTGGVRPDNLADYLAIPAVLAVGGTWITTPQLLADRDFTAIGDLAHKAAELAQTLRPHLPARTTS